MYLIIKTFLLYFIVYAVAFEDIYVNGQGAQSQEMIEQGRLQYQLLRERGSLPQYGTCWKSAVEHVNEGCKHLSEETQSDIALHLTNCFLSMSGHDTYNCELDKKANLRGICINSMSDRAFNVYTEFYTHTQNICWFLRGQIWHETISENTFKVGEQLKYSAKNQEMLLKSQRESLQLQEKILDYGKNLENVISDLFLTMKVHGEVLDVLGRNMRDFQSWIIGEVSWFDSIIFYFVAIFIVIIFTSTKRTIIGRLPSILILLVNFLSERLICSILIASTNPDFTYKNIYYTIWYCRYFFITINIIYLIYQAYNYKDYIKENHKYLENINNKVIQILNKIELNSPQIKNKSDRIHVIDENYQHSYNKSNGNYFINNDLIDYSISKVDKYNNKFHNSPELPKNDKNLNNYYKDDISESSKENVNSSAISSRKPLIAIKDKYNLRSKSRTPDCRY